ncbi:MULTISPECIES: glycosyltransferase family 2 protein [unclassified Mesorhizobium]|uniref:glycosyltransferase family A protein n=1 Tax=unclassified Mesorhizobium TaxID=325217 RepID=UPI000F7648B6|nr:MULTISPECIES: glycosyltransferase family 2 protein [unclassified Mesorhizobium]AZO09411.1 glycosyltransferase family 2 protein [Mesorhizobium sp. M3A.F.Ca.ET.080.04.2.1]RWB67989.1 MAG: glycosyltransferase family 2 protein [Mesorhizobium sp.]RWB87746.1 MAG: glycosyltransferase family 2 protein [Mesorhizobium sp.]RWE36233.1 MAG: glycosyltransferase family 2 protein [Mesorhizobium sp.]RWF26319.1 MAG: glycosyltransferase family 2 protein [Mesorhizobium sp.]
MTSVDVIIPCYNYAHYLPQCVNSVVSQDVDDLRVLIIDNASIDKSVEVARRLAEKDRRIEVVCHETNLGPHASFNEGIDRARADYFMILCADDILVPGALRRGMEILERCPEATFVLGASSQPFMGDIPPELDPLPEGGSLLSGRDYIRQCCAAAGENSGAHAILVRTPVQKSVGYYCANLTHMDDLEMVMRLASMGSVARLRGALVSQRMHVTNQLSVLWHDRLSDLQEREAAFNSFFCREGWDIPGSKRLHRTAMQQIAATAFWSAASHFYRGKLSAGLSLLRYSLGLDPTLAILPPVDYLFRTQGALRRMAAVMSGASR